MARSRAPIEAALIRLPRTAGVCYSFCPSRSGSCSPRRASRGGPRRRCDGYEPKSTRRRAISFFDAAAFFMCRRPLVLVSMRDCCFLLFFFLFLFSLSTSPSPVFIVVIKSDLFDRASVALMGRVQEMATAIFISLFLSFFTIASLNCAARARARFLSPGAAVIYLRLSTRCPRITTAAATPHPATKARGAVKRRPVDGQDVNDKRKGSRPFLIRPTPRFACGLREMPRLG